MQYGGRANPGLSANMRIDVEKVCQHSSFNSGRSPFYKVQQRVTAVAVLPRRHSTLTVRLDGPVVTTLKDPTKGYQLHLRIFSIQNYTHQDWHTAAVAVRISGKNKHIEQKTNKKKNLGYLTPKPLDISRDAQQYTQIEMISTGNFTGIGVVELVKVSSVEELAQRILKKSGKADQRKCELCDKTENLLRCSRCKGAWYCSTDHQIRDWAYHQTICSPRSKAKSRSKLKRARKAQTQGEVVMGEQRVSLRCPLSIMRIKTPVRGVSCDHPQAIDMHSFLNFCNASGNWQCPVCMKSLKYEELLIDTQIQEILAEVPAEIDQVRLKPDGTFVPITLDEIKAEDRAAGENRAAKKQKKSKAKDPNDTPKEQVIVLE